MRKYRQQLFLLLGMYLVYAGYLFLKTSIVASGPALLSDASMHLDKADWGIILGCGTIGGILGKFVSGWFADRLGGKIVFSAGILVTSLGVALFSRFNELFFFAIVYFIVLLANAAGWPSMAKLIANWFTPNQYGRIWGIISTSSRVGTILATLTMGALLHSLDWRQSLLVTASIGGVLLLLSLFLVKEHPHHANEASITSLEDRHCNHHFYQVPLQKAFLSSLKNKRFLLISASMMGLTILWDFLNFVPLYLNEALGFSSADAALATSSFPVGSLISVLVGGFLLDKMPRKKFTLLMAFYLTVAVCSLILLYALPILELSNNQKVTTTLMTLFLFGFTVSPAYYLPMSIFAIEYGGPHSGFLIAFLDAIGFAASVVFSFVGGRIATSGGWGYFLGLLISIAFLSLLATVWFLAGEDRFYQSKTENLH